MHDLNENFVQGLKEKWAPVLDHEDQAPIADAYRRNVTAILLENTEQAVRKETALGTSNNAVNEVHLMWLQQLAHLVVTAQSNMQTQ